MSFAVEKETEGSLIIWRIENFSHCSQKKKEHLRSPIFVVDTLDNTKWQLLLVPRGADHLRSNNYSVGYFLKRYSDNGPESIFVNFVFSIRDVNGSFLEKNKLSTAFVKNSITGYQTLLSRDAVYGRKGIGFLHNDTLTLCCRMWRGDAQPSKSAQYFARTRIRVERKTFTWVIEDFSALQINQKKTIQVETSLEPSPTLKMNIFLSGECFSEERIQVELISNDRKNRSFVTCKISLLDVERKVVTSVRDHHWFEIEVGEHVWQFPTLITSNKLMSGKCTYLPNDKLSLKCELAISEGSESSEVEHTICGPPAFETLDAIVEDVDSRICCANKNASSNISESLKNDLHILYTEEKFSDFTLRTEKKSYPVHKAILGARSPVFSARFERDMKEKETGVVKIEDLDDDVVQRMLLFMYTDAVKGLEWENTKKLYGAADKYGILPLKQKCSYFLKTNLNPSNVCEALVLADMHHDEDMKSATLDFISIHDTEIIGSDAWNTFMQSSYQLAAETLQEIYMKKF